jgi:pyruvate kinase
MRKTKIVCTLGPASDSPEMLQALLKAGMDIARLNFSHGSHEEHGQRIRNLRQACQETGKTAAIMLDTSGPEIRTGQVAGNTAELKADQEFTLTTRLVPGDPAQISVTYDQLPASVAPGQTILLDDGLIRLEVLHTTDTDIICKVMNGGTLTHRRKVNVPGAALPFPVMTEKDREDLRFGVSQGVDIIAASFVRSAEDVHSIRQYLNELGGHQFIIAKIESRQGVDQMEAILAEADGLMVARGDLGVEISPEEVPLVQKHMIQRCNQVGKPVITATQMLDSMIRNPRPTRAEASDVANAILDGTDAIMLSGETAAGLYPLEAVSTMSRIADTTEASEIWHQRFLHYFAAMDSQQETTSDSVARAVCLLAEKIHAKAILTSTHAGFTARQISRFRPHTEIIATTPLKYIHRQLLLSWGITPLTVDPYSTTDEMIHDAIDAACGAGLLQEDDLIIITAGIPVGVTGTTNLIKVHRVGSPFT